MVCVLTQENRFLQEENVLAAEDIDGWPPPHRKFLTQKF